MTPFQCEPTKLSRTHRLLAAGSVLLLGTLSSACIAPVDDYEMPDESSDDGSEELNGIYTTVGCDAEAIDKIDDAMALIVNRMNQSEYLTCLRDAVWSGADGAMPEDVLARLRENMPTQITCQDIVCGNDDSWGCAGVGNGPEEFTIKNDHVHDSAAGMVAATIVHEVSHRKAYGHPGNSGHLDYPFTIPVQAASCIVNTEADGLDRSHAEGDTWLSHAGGTGGQPFERRCAGDRYATGMIVDSSSRVNRLRLRCDNTTTAAAGSYKDSTQTRDRSCASGQQVIGVWGASSDMVNYVGMVCASENDLRNDEPNPSKSYQSVGGQWAGRFFMRTCPTGMALKGVGGRHGARIDQLKLLCEDVDGKKQAAPHRISMVGTKTGSSKIGQCIGHGVMTGLYGHAGGEVDRLGADCKPTRQADNAYVATPVVETGNTVRGVTDWSGGNGGLPFNQSCGDGWAMVGIEVRSGARLDAIRPICAAPNQWSATSGTVVTWSPSSFAGGSGGVLRTRKCARGEYMVGMETWAAQNAHATPTMQGVEPICRAIKYGIIFQGPTDLEWKVD